jgi:hypothetical protein
MAGLFSVQHDATSLGVEIVSDNARSPQIVPTALGGNFCQQVDACRCLLPDSFCE